MRKTCLYCTIYGLCINPKCDKKMCRFHNCFCAYYQRGVPIKSMNLEYNMKLYLKIIEAKGGLIVDEYYTSEIQLMYSDLAKFLKWYNGGLLEYTTSEGESLTPD